MSAEMKAMAKMALNRLTSGFWQDEKNRRKKTLTILRNQGADTCAAANFLVANTKKQIAAETNPEEELLYRRVKTIFQAGNGENALAALIDQEQIKTMDDCAKQRYIFNLSSKLQEFRERYEKEQQFNCQTMSV